MLDALLKSLRTMHELYADNGALELARRRMLTQLEVAIRLLSEGATLNEIFGAMKAFVEASKEHSDIMQQVALVLRAIPNQKTISQN